MQEGGVMKSVDDATSAIGRVSLLTPSVQTSTPLHQATAGLRHRNMIQRELKLAGVSWYGLLKDESRYLHRIIRPNDHIKAVVYGWNSEGSAMIIATDTRLIYLDKKPLFVKTDELTYEIVSGVMSTHAGPFISFTLHTRMGDYMLKTFIPKTTALFVSFIEARCLENFHRRIEPLNKLLW
jgi:hypothetical protein